MISEMKTLAIIGYQMYFLGKTKQDLDNSTDLEVIMINDEFDKMIQPDGTVDLPDHIVKRTYLDAT